MKKKLEQHEAEALQRWIDVHGRRWKAALNDAWFCGTYIGITPGRVRDETTLQGLRYKYGPSGLDKLTAPMVARALA